MVFTRNIAQYNSTHHYATLTASSQPRFFSQPSQHGPKTTKINCPQNGYDINRCALRNELQSRGNLPNLNLANCTQSQLSLFFFILKASLKNLVYIITMQTIKKNCNTFFSIIYNILLVKYVSENIESLLTDKPQSDKLPIEITRQ